MSNKIIKPLHDLSSTNPAVELIRAKVSRAYSDEPDALQELESSQKERVLSKHQHYMQTLSSSGKSLAEVQTAWHHYYTTLPDAEKHEVWQEFYAANQQTPYQKLFQKQATVTEAPVQAASRNPLIPEAPVASASGAVVADHSPVPVEAAPKARTKRPRKQIITNPTAQALKQKVANRVSANGKLSAKHHLQSLGFGIGVGLTVLAVFLFTFFNQYVIAPFIQPSRNVSSTPIILSSAAVAVDAPPSITIPKINIQIPLVYNVASYADVDVDKGLESGVIHYPNTAMPGQNGNGAYFGHSSGNIFNNGKYKFAFTLLHDVTTGDLFYITYGGKTYAYRVFAREIVPPTAISVISDTKGKQATAALITCDPPGLSTNRLVIWGEQISPDPATNAAPTQPTTTQTTPVQIAGNGPTLWGRFVGWVSFWN